MRAERGGGARSGRPARGLGRLLTAAISVALLFALTASAAGAFVVREHGHRFGALARRAVGNAPASHIVLVSPSPPPLRASSRAAGGAGGPALALSYHGGPIVRAHKTYAIYWNPSGQIPFPGTYATSINRFLSDVATDSGQAQNVYSTNAQYGDPAGGVYRSTYAGAVTDTNPFPFDQSRGNAGGCQAGQAHPGDPAYTWCLTDQQIQAEVQTVLAQHPAWSTGYSGVVFVFLPAGVDECMASGPESAANQCADQDFCAYHNDYGPSPSPTLYAVIPWTAIAGCRSGQSPNGSGGDSPADDAINIVSHEHSETVTDPLLTSWYDVNGLENGDKCAFNYGTALGGAPSAQFNQVINGNHYWLQQEWSNDGQSCLQRHLVAHFAAAGAGGPNAPGAPVHFDGSGSQEPASIASYSWDFGDGATATAAASGADHTYARAGTYSATLTVIDTAGNTSASTQQVVIGGPVAAFIAPTSASSATPAHFDASSSYEPGGSLTAWSWNFGDSTTGAGALADHSFVAAGTYTVTLTVQDASGNSASVSHVISVVTPPASAPIAPTNTPPAQSAAPAGLSESASLLSPLDSSGQAGNGALHVRLRHGHVLLRSSRALRCPVGLARCAISVAVILRVPQASSASRRGRRIATRSLVIANATLSSTDHAGFTLSLPLNGRGIALLREMRRLHLSLDLSARLRTGAGVGQTVSATVPAAPRLHLFARISRF